MTTYIILIGIMFIGGIFGLCKCGENEGICSYGQVGEVDVQN